LGYKSKIAQELLQKATQTNTNQYNKGQYWDAPKQESQPYKSKIASSLLGKPFTPDPNYYPQKDIQDITANLQQNNMNVPAPDVQNKTGRAWYERYIFDPLSSLQYGLARGTLGAVDDDKNTNFFTGAAEGIKAGLNVFNDNDADKRTSWTDVLNTLYESQNETKQNIAKGIAGTVGAIGTAYAQANGASEDEAYRSGMGFAGTVGDIFLDPANLLSGLGGAVELMTKGSKALDVADTVGDIGKATDALKAANLASESVDAERVLNKAAKTAGYMNDYKGIGLKVFGKEATIIPASVIGKVADYSPFKLIGQAGDKLLNTEPIQVFNKAFVGGKYSDLVLDSKLHPENAIKNTVAIESFNRLVSKRKMNGESLMQTTKWLQDNFGDDLKNKKLRDILENPDKYELSDITVTHDTTALNRKKTHIGTVELPKLQQQITDLEKHISDLQSSGANEAQLTVLKSQAARLRIEMETVGTIQEGMKFNYVENLKGAGSKLLEVNPNDPVLVDPAYVVSESLDSLKNYIKTVYSAADVDIDDAEALEEALRIRKTAEATIDKIESDIPELKDKLAGTKRIHSDDLLNPESRTKLFEDGYFDEPEDMSETDMFFDSNKQFEEEDTARRAEIEAQREAAKKQYMGEQKSNFVDNTGTSDIKEFPLNITPEAENVINRQTRNPISDLLNEVAADVDTKPIAKGMTKEQYNRAKLLGRALGDYSGLSQINTLPTNKIDEALNALEKQIKSKQIDELDKLFKLQGRGVVDDYLRNMEPARLKTYIDHVKNSLEEELPYDVLHADEIINQKLTQLGEVTGKTFDLDNMSTEQKQKVFDTLKGKLDEQLAVARGERDFDPTKALTSKEIDRRINFFRSKGLQVTPEQAMRISKREFEEMVDDYAQGFITESEMADIIGRESVRKDGQGYTESFRGKDVDSMGNTSVKNPGYVVDKKSGQYVTAEPSVGHIKPRNSYSKGVITDGRQYESITKKQEELDSLGLLPEAYKSSIREALESGSTPEGMADYSRGVNEIYNALKETPASQNTLARIDILEHELGKIPNANKFGIKIDDKFTKAGELPTIEALRDMNELDANRALAKYQFVTQTVTPKQANYINWKMNELKKIDVDKYNEWQKYFKRNDINFSKMTRLEFDEYVNRIDSFLKKNGVKVEEFGTGLEDEFAPTFYYKSNKILDQKKFSKGNAEDVLKMLKSSGVKEEELKWLGINDFIESKKGQTITRKELDEVISMNDLQLKEVQSPSGESIGAMTNFKPYSLDGGENYKEFLIIQPENNFTHNHWGDDKKGVIGHIRTQDFVDTDGNKVLMIEELQSDLHEKGLKDGYITSENAANRKAYTALKAERLSVMDEYSATNKKIMENSDANPIKKLLNIGETKKNIEKLDGLRKKIQEIESKIDSFDLESMGVSSVPEAPFKNTWQEYELKRMIRYAAENDYDKIAWTTGKQQVERFDLGFKNQGMKNFYDVGGKSSQNVPKFLDKYVSQWGSKVGTTQVKAAIDETKQIFDKDEIIDAFNKGTKLSYNKWSDFGDEVTAVEIKSREELDEVLNSKSYKSGVTGFYFNESTENLLIQPSIDITPEMKKSVLYEGQPMFFSQEYGNPGKKLVTPNDTVDMYNFKTYRGDVNIDSNANPEKARGFVQDFKNMTNDLDVANLTQGNNTNYIVGDYGKAKGFNLGGDKTVLENDIPANQSWVLRHETAEDIRISLSPKAKGELNTLIQDGIKTLSEGDREELTRLVKESINLPDSMREKLVNAINNGFVSPYAAQKGSGENIAEFGALLFTKGYNDKIAEAIRPAREKFYEYLENMPKGYMDMAIPKRIKNRDEIVRMYEGLQNAIEATKNVMDEIQSASSDLSKAKKQYEELSGIMDDDVAFKDWFKNKYPNVPFEETETIPNAEFVRKDRIGELTDEQELVYRTLKENFKVWGIQEGRYTQEEADEAVRYYLTHVQQFDLRKTATSGVASTLGDVYDPYAVRKYKKTIDEINQIMKDKHGIDNFFETSLDRIFLERGLKHNKMMFEKDMVNKAISIWGERIDGEYLDSLDEVARKDLKQHIYDMTHSKDNPYVIVKIDDGYEEKLVNTISSVELESADIKHAADQGINPFIEIDPRSIKPEKLFEKKQGQIYMMPKSAYKATLDTIQGEFKTTKSAALKIFDQFNNLFKAQAVTSVGFHTTNEIGNLMNSYLGVGARILDPSINVTALKLLAGKGKFMGWSAEDFMRMANELDVIDNGMFSDQVGDFLKGKVDSLTDSPVKKLLKKINPLSNENIVFSANRSIGSTIENQSKLVNFMIHLKDGKTPQEAADLVHKYLFDYSDITKFEKDWMKRIFPFYTFFRKNVPLQLGAMLDTPGRATAGYKILKDMAQPETDQQKALRPEYLDDATYMGNNTYKDINMPYKDLNKLTKPNELFGMLNPLAKLLVELPANKNMYFDSPIAYREGDTTKAPWYTESFAQDTPSGKVIDSKVRYALRNLLPLLERVGDIGAGLDDNASIAEREKASGILGGNRSYTVDFEKQKQQAMYDYVQKLKDVQANSKEAGYIKEQKTPQKKYKSKVANDLLSR
jgi:hypothetical protein